MDILKHIRGLFIIHVPRYTICKDKTVSSEIFLHKQFGEKRFCRNRHLLITGLASNWCKVREPPNKLAADTAPMPKGVPSENLNYQNSTKQFQIITGGVFPLNLKDHTFNKDTANIVQEIQ